MIGEFISTLAMALKCYPLQPGGLLALQAIALGLTTPDAVYREVRNNFPVILLLMLMVADIYFMKDRRRPHHGGRAAEPIDCREDGLGVQRIFRACGAGVTAGAGADS